MNETPNTPESLAAPDPLLGIPPSAKQDSIAPTPAAIAEIAGPIVAHALRELSPKAGVRTTEFWLLAAVVVAVLVEAHLGTLPPDIAIFVSGFLSLVWATFRWLLKSAVLERLRGIQISTNQITTQQGASSNAVANAQEAIDDNGDLPETARNSLIRETGLVDGGKRNPSAPSAGPAQISSTANGAQGEPATGRFSPHETKPKEEV